MAPFKQHIALWPLLVITLFFVGCGRSCSSYYHSDSTINGRRTIVHKQNDITWKLAATTNVDIKNGQIATLPTGTIVTLQETDGNHSREAELRENAGNVELWIKDKDGFHKGSAEDDVWLQGFLNNVSSK